LTAPDAHSVSVLLAARIVELAPRLLPSGRREGASWRVGGLDGARGSSLAIALTGIKQGLWIDHATGERGDALDLVKGARHCNTLEAIEWSRKWLAGAGQPRPSPPNAGDSDDEARRVEMARAIWDDAVSPRHTPVHTYLSRRALKLKLTDALAGKVIRFHPECPWKDANGKTILVPAMVVAMRSIETDEITAIQRTRLSPDGKKIDRRMLGVAAGAAVKLDANESVADCLIIGEGNETAMTARQIGLKPAWALGSANAIATFPVLVGIERLGILAERDEANERATEACATRWHGADREVFIIRPTTGNDLNDALQAMQRARRLASGRRRAS
jgi:Toprim domain